MLTVSEHLPALHGSDFLLHFTCISAVNEPVEGLDHTREEQRAPSAGQESEGTGN